MSPLVRATFQKSVIPTGPKGGGRHGGIPLSVGPTSTLIRRHEGIEMRLPNTDLLLWHTPF
ncbi:hypothetical protein MPY17_08070 [Rhodococcus opacus]|uniref:hypothetical protein n=1 Tax=Rhodococcus opacus TaxID=37919 RepID=UPI001FF5113A|nr:hypothetical protein [Rhodococcus opacus]UOT05690.1 hypothetical protein MPY17_08070 [Rhodococcus opacus]